MDKHIEVVGGHKGMAKHTGQVRIKMWDNNGNTFIAILHNVLLAPDLCGGLFSIIMLMNLVNTCLFHKGFCAVDFGENREITVTLPQSAQRKYVFFAVIKEMSKTKKLPSRTKIALEFLHHRLGYISTRSLLDGDTANFW